MCIRDSIYEDRSRGTEIRVPREDYLEYIRGEKFKEVDPKRQLMFISNADKLAYMTTEQWKQLKLERLKIAQNKCESCGSTHNLHLHHITYERLTQELIEDVAILCGGIDGCHQKLHDIAAKQHPKNPYGREHIYSLDFLKNLP